MNQFANAPHLNDMTRWNRAGLDRFRYTGEAAAEFTEALRIAHLLLYAKGQHPDDIDTSESWRAAYESADGKFEGGELLKDALAELRSRFSRPDMDGVPPHNATYDQQLLAQYQAVLTDPSAQISRAFARALHVLSETLNAYANEGTLRSATQTVHAYHLLSLIGFRASLAASAITPISYQLNLDAGRINLVEGLAFDYALPEGGENLTFEALAAISGHASLNAMKAKGYNDQLDLIDGETTDFELLGKSVFSSDLKNTIAVLGDGSSREAVRISDSNEVKNTLTLTRNALQNVSGHYQSAHVLTSPKIIYEARPRGSSWLHFETAPDVFPQSIILIETNSSSDYYRVKEVRGRDIRVTNLVNHNVLIAINEFEVVNAGGAVAGGGVESRMLVSGSHFEVASPFIVRRVYSTIMTNEADQDMDKVFPIGPVAHFPISVEPLFLKRGPELGNLIQFSANSIYFDDVKKAEINALQFTVVETDSLALLASGLTFVSSDDHGVAYSIDKTGVSASDVIKIYGNFGLSSGLANDPRSHSALVDPDSDTMTLLCPFSEQDLLRPGRALLLESQDGQPSRMISIKRVVAQSEQAGTITLTMDDGGQDLSGYQKGFTTVHGNVATFGHGKSLPARVLGSGDGGQGEQLMVIEDEAVSTRLNPSFPGGVAADIQVTVDGQIWQQISSDIQDAEDGPYYSVALQRDNTLGVSFHRRLSTGTDNVELSRIRVGTGKAGNEIPAYGVKNLQPKHASVDSIVQPLAPQSGADLQGLEALRSEGKSRYALFGRALAVGDFARLAETHVGVLHAHAVLVRQGAGRSGNKIKLSVAPSGGQGIDLFKADLITMLLAACLPGTHIVVLPFKPVLLGGVCKIVLKPGYPDEYSIRAELESALIERFGLAARPLGKQLYTSEIAAEIEAHGAVEYVTVDLVVDCAAAYVRCEFSADGVVQAVRPDANAAVYLEDETALTLEFNFVLEGGV